MKLKRSGASRPVWHCSYATDNLQLYNALEELQPDPHLLLSLRLGQVEQYREEMENQLCQVQEMDAISEAGKGIIETSNTVLGMLIALRTRGTFRVISCNWR
jgi:hypothetical protein